MNNKIFLKTNENSMTSEMSTKKNNENNLYIEDILNNCNDINDLLINNDNLFNKILTLSNIIQLIRYSLGTNEINNEYSDKEKIYAFYSCLILCSEKVLLFNKSLEFLKKGNNLKSLNSSLKQGNNVEFLIIKEKNNLSKDIKEKIDNFSSKDIYEKEIKGKYFDSILYLKEKSKNCFEKIPYNYKSDDMIIINKILEEIFGVLNSEKPITEVVNMRNFEKIINYLLFNESNVIIEFLFKDYTFFINNLYQNLNNSSIENIFDNIINILSDKEEKFEYLKKLLNNLFESLINDEHFEKIKYICNIFINNLQTNAGNILIEIIFQKIKHLKKFFEKITNINNNDILIINSTKVLYELNNIIIKSLIFTYNYKIENRENKKLNLYEYKYFCAKTINYKYIFTIFEQNSNLYLSLNNDICNLISKDIKSSSNKNKIGFKCLYEWKLILITLKLYIYLDYNFKNENFFFAQELSLISINLYLHFPKNNIFQNIFIEIIKLVTDKKSPEFLTKLFLIIDDKKENFLYKILNDIENNRLTLGTNIEILKLFYHSSNSTILKFFEDNESHNFYKNIFIDIITPKYERELNSEYDYSFSEIFDNDNEDENTFDGNDSNIFRKYESFKTLIKKFLSGCKKIKNII